MRHELLKVIRHIFGWPAYEESSGRTYVCRIVASGPHFLVKQNGDRWRYNRARHAAWKIIPRATLIDLLLGGPLPLPTPED